MPLHNQTRCIFFARQCHNNTFLPINGNNDHAHSSHERPPAAGARRVIVQDNNNRKEWAHTTPPRYALHPDHSCYPPHTLYTPPFPAVSAWQRQCKVGATVVALRPSEIAAQYFLLGQTSGKKDGKATWPCKDTSQFGWYMPPPFQMSVHFGFSPSMDPCSHIGYNFKRYN